MSIEALRKKRRMRRPKQRLTDGQKSMLLLALTFVTGSLVLAIILPLLFLAVVMKWGGDGTAE